MATDERYNRYDDTDSFYADEFGERIENYDASDEELTDEELMADDSDTTGLVDDDDETTTDFHERLTDAEMPTAGDTGADTYDVADPADETPTDSGLDPADRDAVSGDDDTSPAHLR